MRRPTAILGILVLALTMPMGCSSGGLDDPKAALSAAKKRLDRADTVHFSVEGEDLPKDGVVMLRGDGSAKRPSSFKGSFRMKTAGLSATVDVVSLDGTIYARLPFTDHFAETSSDELGIPDPALLLGPDDGMSSLLTEARNPTATGQTRRGDEVLNEVTAKLPADIVGRFLYVADQSATIRTTFSLIAESDELRSATFTGPFYGGEEDSTYTVMLDGYGDPVTINRP